MQGMENFKIKIIGLPAMFSSPFAVWFLKGNCVQLFYLNIYHKDID
jgi:hypothetical protein